MMACVGRRGPMIGLRQAESAVVGLCLVEYK